MSILRPVLALALATVIVPTAAGQRPPGPRAQVAVPDTSTRLHEVVEECFDRWLELHPLIATEIGDDRFDDRFDDGISQAYRAHLAELSESCLALIATVDRSALAGEARLTYDLFVREMELQRADLAFPDHLLQVSFFLSSAPFAFARMAGDGRQPFDDVDDYDRFLSRLEGFVAWVDVAIAAMREGIERGIVHSRLAVEPALAQLDALIDSDPKRTPFWSPVERMPAAIPPVDRARIETAFATSIRERVVPAYAELASFLRETYLTAARESPSLSALPRGRDWYSYKVRRYTTTSLSPAEVMAEGVSEAKRLIEEFRLEARKMGFRDGLTGLFTALATDPSLRVRGERRVVRRYEEIRERVEPRLPRLFTRLPQTPFTVEPVPDFLAAGAPGAFYVPPRSGADGHGTFFVKVTSAGARGPGMEALFLHEAVPGHHFQGALARELADLPRFRRYGYQGAFIEGWALYAEGLGKELGLYKDPWQRVGRLFSEMLRAARLVLDVGIHHEGWTAAEAREIAETRLLGFGAAEIPRYAAEPAQALTYKIGQLTISRLRTRAETELGDRFDLRAFHHEVLRHGPLPLDVLETVVDEWIAARRSRGDEAAPRGSRAGSQRVRPSWSSCGTRSAYGLDRST